MEMTHVTTSPYYPQSNGKQERFYSTLKNEGVRPFDLSDLESAKNRISYYVTYYNETRLHSAIGYVAPLDKLLGREKDIFEQRKIKLTLAAKQRSQAYTGTK